MNDSGIVPAPISVLGVNVNPVTRAQLLRLLLQWAADRERRYVFYANVHAVNLAQSLPDFKQHLNSASLVFCDGHGLKLGATMLGRSLPERMTPPDWIDDFAAGAAQAGVTIFALGDEAGVASTFARRLSAAHPGLNMVGSAHGFFDKSGPENDMIVARINASAADVLLVGLGMPIQERWVVANASRLSPRLIVTVGALYRWYAGIDNRAPAWVTDSGFEWLSRLLSQPRRHFRRYALGNPLFILRVVIERVRDLVGGAPRL